MKVIDLAKVKVLHIHILMVFHIYFYKNKVKDLVLVMEIYKVKEKVMDFYKVMVIHLEKDL